MGMFDKINTNEMFKNKHEWQGSSALTKKT